MGNLPFIWDYDYTEDEIRNILKGKDSYIKAWVVGRIIEHGTWKDIKKFIRPKDVLSSLTQMEEDGLAAPETIRLWRSLLKDWGYVI
jgi:hypothetical protein